MLSDQPEPFRLLTCYYRPKPGGFCKRLFRGIRALLKKGHTVHYLAVVPFPIEHPNCHFHRFPWPEERTAGYLFWGCFHLLAPMMLLCIGVRYRINRLFAFGYTYSLFLQPLRLVKRLPLTVFLRADTVRNHEIKERSRLLTQIELILEGVGIAGTRMYAVSETLKNAVHERHSFLKPAISGVLRNEIPMPLPGSTANRAREMGIPLRVACVGVLEPRKNQRFLLEVFKQINAEQAQLYLYGTGPDEQLLRETVRKEGMSDRVHFMGWVPSESIWPEVDLLLMPSLHEGAPNAVLEALGNGIPVLASDIPEHGEILQQEYLLPASSPEQWNIFLNKFPPPKGRGIDNQCSLTDNVASEGVLDPRLGNKAKELVFDWDNNFVEAIIK